ncbi:MAG: helix-turn-helix domain-containing protein [Bacilli bacterium]
MYNKLKEVRRNKKMTAREVAEKVGISKPFYCQIENCKRRLSYDTAVKIANVFGVKPDYLFYDDTVMQMENVD